VPLSKKELRARFRQLLRSPSEAQLGSWNLALGARLLALSRDFPPQAFVATYCARQAEASPAALLQAPFRFCFPRVTDDKSGLMEFRAVERGQEEAQLKPGYQGLLEPVESCAAVAKERISVCLVPLLAFDGLGGRLGHGKGFYDRFLQGFAGLKVGVAFECQLSLEPLPVESHDQRLDLVVTELRARDFR
jgi:5-formyltetrahydrofolate cyclo-ligase